MTPALPAHCSQHPPGHGAQGPGRRYVNPFLGCSAGGPGGIRCGARVGSPAGTGVWEELGRPVLRCDPLCSWWEGLVDLAGGSAILRVGGEPQEAHPRAAQVSQGGLSLSSGHSAGGMVGRITVPENRTWEQVPAADRQAARGDRADGARRENLLQTPPDSLLGLHVAFLAPSACLQDEDTNQRGQELAQGPTAHLGRAPWWDLEKGIPSAPPAPEMKAAPGIPRPQKDPLQARGGIRSPHPGEPRAGAPTPGPCASQPKPAEPCAQPRAPPAKPPLQAAGEPFRTAHRPQRTTAHPRHVPRGLERHSLQLRAGRVRLEEGWVWRGSLSERKCVRTCLHGARSLEGTKVPKSPRG